MRSAACKLLFSALPCLFALVPAYGIPVYNNTVTDTQSTLPYGFTTSTQLGDRILLAGTERYATLATVQFFNIGASGSFDAALRLFNIGSPVGSQLGSTYTVTGISALANDAVNVSFSFPNLLVPNELIFTVSVANESGVTIFGVDMFEPPVVGSSDNTFAIGFDGSSFNKISTQSENVFFALDASATSPEPSTLALAAAAGLFLIRRRART
jgi:MYXO-CTERM domain-containing protein